MKVVFIALALITLIGCTNQSDAMRALTAQGFTDVRFTGYSFFACGKDDFFHTGFIAKNAQGLEVKGTVCSGLIFKNSTIRF